MLTRDEEENLPTALVTVPLESPVLVIDAQSTDLTVDRAHDRGADVVVRPWEGFVATRLFALGLVNTTWTFMLDADERLDERLQTALIETIVTPEIDGYRVRRINMFCGRPVRGGAWGRDEPLRLFRTARASLLAEPAAGGAAALHERWAVPGAVGNLAGTLEHNSYPSLASYREKFERYTSIEARGLRPSRIRFVGAILMCVPRMLYALGPRGGWRDGWRGVYIAGASAIYPIVASWKALRAKIS